MRNRCGHPDVVFFSIAELVSRETQKKHLGVEGHRHARRDHRFLRRRAFVHADLKYNEEKVPAQDIWKNAHMHRDDAKAIQLFRDGKFKIVRTSPELMLTSVRWFNDHAFRDPTQPIRWTHAKDSGWKKGGPSRVFSLGLDQEIDWLSYRHFRRQDKARLRGAARPRPILVQSIHVRIVPSIRTRTWVGDLMIDCRSP